jgi:hypothetical protein
MNNNQMDNNQMDNNKNWSNNANLVLSRSRPNRPQRVCSSDVVYRSPGGAASTSGKRARQLQGREGRREGHCHKGCFQYRFKTNIQWAALKLCEAYHKLLKFKISYKTIEQELNSSETSCDEI